MALVAGSEVAMRAYVEAGHQRHFIMHFTPALNVLK